jgi:EAL domain-containing protein (putative c-di-GMP-specific phosphodiesterase class I)/GGDEF domain-containing protein
MTSVALYFHGGETVIGHHIRLIGASMSALLMMQFIMRNISEIASDSMETTGGLNGLISKLESDLRFSMEENYKAISEEPESGLINLYGISLREQELLSRIENGEELIVAAIRCNRFSDSISTLPDKERYVMLSRTIRRIQNCIGEKSILARVGRNDYIAILESPDFDRLSTLFEGFKEPISHEQTRVVITPFIGYVRWESDCSDILLAVRKSEIALASAAEQNRINAVEFDDNMLNSITDRNELLNDLAADVSLSQFELKFQPIVDLKSGEIRKFEALIRWNHPVKGMISPNNFIPMAESSSLIFRMTDWVIATAHSKLLNLRESLGEPIKISVNIPAVYLENGVVDKAIFISNLRAISSSFEGIVLEITEGSMLRSTPEMTDLMNDLRGLHFEFALDDFGVGHSNLSRLEDIPLSYLKIDKSFVDKIETSKTKYYICTTIIKFAHQLGLKVVAEGIENDLQHDLLKKAKCDFGQGYLFSKPVSAELLPGLVASCRLSV